MKTWRGNTRKIIQFVFRKLTSYVEENNDLNIRIIFLKRISKTKKHNNTTLDIPVKRTMNSCFVLADIHPIQPSGMPLGCVISVWNLGSAGNLRSENISWFTV